jgi:WD40 repeat protein
MPRYFLVCLLLVIGSLPVRSLSQTCSPPQIVFNTASENIFTPDQEMILGDVMFERAASDFQVIDDPELTAYLQSIGDRIAANLPQTGLKYKFFLIDLPTTNALTLAGGRIMITRKMVSFARSEDELAAVIGHELGHAVVRHSAIDVSKYFKTLLGVRSVTDRKDIFEKYNRMLELQATRTVKTSRNHSDNEQMEADKIGIYAAYAAGYDPSVFADFWSRLTDAEEKGVFDRLFGLQTPDDKRLREMVGALKTIPGECRHQVADKTKETADYYEWRNDVIAYTGLGEKEVLSGLTKKVKLAPLRSGIQYLRFSPNGEYILAQDYTTITVLKRDPLSVLFRIDAVETLPATFSADSQKIIALSSYDRVEIWDVAQKTKESVYDFPPPSGAINTTISPDGKNAIVYKSNGDLVVYDVFTGRQVFLDEKFYSPGEVEFLLRRFGIDASRLVVMNTMFSDDGRYVVVGHSFTPTGVSKRDPFAAVRESRTRVTGSRSGPKAEAIDLRTYTKIKVGDNIQETVFFGGAFLDNRRILGKIAPDIDKSGIFAFPSGERLEKFELSGVRFTPGFSGRYITVRPVANAPAGIYDLKEKAFVIASLKSAIDVYGDVFVSELISGELAISDLKSAKVISKIDLPPSPLGTIRTASLSDDAQWLTLSEGSRGAAWNLLTGKSIFDIRYFRGSYISPEAVLYADYPEDSLSTRTVARVDLKTAKIQRAGYKLPDALVRQYGKYLVALSSEYTKRFYEAIRSEKNQKRLAEGVAFDPNMSEPGFVGRQDVNFQILDATNGSTLWTRHFANEAPQYVMNTALDTLTFYWRSNQKAAKKLIDADPKLKLASKADDYSDYDIVAEIIDPNSGHVRNRVLIHTGEGSFIPTAVWTSGDYLTVVDDSNRTLIYSVSTGKLLHRFFGSSSEISVAANLIAVENPTGWINIYDLKTGSRKERLGFTSPLVFLDFFEDGRKLFVLTADQIAFTFDTTKFNGRNLTRPVETMTTESIPVGGRK